MFGKLIVDPSMYRFERRTVQQPAENGTMPEPQDIVVLVISSPHTPQFEIEMPMLEKDDPERGLMGFENFVNQVTEFARKPRIATAADLAKLQQHKPL